MGTTYAVSWRNGTAGERHVGKLVVGAVSASLVGRVRGRASAQEIDFSKVEDVRLDRSADGREHGRPSIVLALGNGNLVRVVSLDQPGTVPEIAGRLAFLAGAAR